MLLSEAWRSLTANLSTTFAATITVLIGMALVGMLVGFGTYARAWTDKTKKELVVHVYFCTDQTCAQYATRKQIDRVRDQAAEEPAGEGRHVHLQGAGVQRACRRANPGLTKQVPNNPLPDAFNVTPKQGRIRRPDREEPEAVPGRSRVPPLRKEDGAQDPERRAPDRGAVPGRRSHPADRLDAADREHDPPVDLLAAKRDRGDEAGRRVQLVRARPVHARGAVHAADRSDPGRHPARSSARRPSSPSIWFKDSGRARACRSR